jgi:hypothetical protein
MSVKIDAEAFKKGIDDAAERYEEAFEASKNIVASMMLAHITTDIQNAGRFGSQFLAGLSVEVTDDGIVTTLDAPGADLFENGGTINGKPLLWLPISGTDAVGIPPSEYGDKLFSVNRTAGGVPLLFSVKDHAPKYFGVPSVTIPKKFHIAEIQKVVMENFKDILEGALNE